MSLIEGKWGNVYYETEGDLRMRHYSQSHKKCQTICICGKCGNTWRLPKERVCYCLLKLCKADCRGESLLQDDAAYRLEGRKYFKFLPKGRV